MPFTVICPACSNPIVATEAAAPYQLVCAKCRNPMTVPAALVPAPVIEDVPARSKYFRREPMSGQGKFFIFVGVLVAIAMGLLIYERVEARLASAKLDSLKTEIKELYDKYAIRADLIERSAPADFNTSQKNELVSSDKELRQINQQAVDAEKARDQILRDHPEWKR